MAEGRLILMAVAGPCETLEVSAPFAASYAARLGADFIQQRAENRGPFQLEKHNFVKLELDRLAKHYAQILWLDADVIVMPGAPDIFAEVLPGALAAWCGEGEVFSAANGEPRPRPLYRHGYFNSGVMVWPSSARGLMGKAVDLWRDRRGRMTAAELAGLFGEQTALNRVAHESGIAVHPLDVRWNHFHGVERCAQFGFPPVEDAHFVHFAGGAHTPQASMDSPARWDQSLRAGYMRDWLTERGITA